MGVASANLARMEAELVGELKEAKPLAAESAFDELVKLLKQAEGGETMVKAIEALNKAMLEGISEIFPETYGNFREILSIVSLFAMHQGREGRQLLLHMGLKIIKILIYLLGDQQIKILIV